MVVSSLGLAVVQLLFCEVFDNFSKFSTSSGSFLFNLGSVPPEEVSWFFLSFFPFNGNLASFLAGFKSSEFASEISSVSLRCLLLLLGFSSEWFILDFFELLESFGCWEVSSVVSRSGCFLVEEHGLRDLDLAASLSLVKEHGLWDLDLAASLSFVKEYGLRDLDLAASLSLVEEHGLRDLDLVASLSLFPWLDSCLLYLSPTISSKGPS